MKTNLFLISSPLHLFVASNLALSKASDRNIALIISKKATLAHQLHKLLDNSDSNIFEATQVLVEEGSKSKLKRRYALKSTLEDVILKYRPSLICTGNDRRFEFQYAMHIASKGSSAVTGAYMDDGAVSYLGHKSIKSFAHRYIDPVLKKLFYGCWWNTGLTVGDSAWVKIAFLAYPEHAHSLLKAKTLVAIDPQYFSISAIRKISEFSVLQAGSENLAVELRLLKTVICLPPDDELDARKTQFLDLFKKLQLTHDVSAIGIKAHPRSQASKLIEKDFAGATVVNQTIGFEFLLPLLDSRASIIGDASSALLTSKWLRPEIDVRTIAVKSSDSQNHLFETLGILPL